MTSRFDRSVVSALPNGDDTSLMYGVPRQPYGFNLNGVDMRATWTLLSAHLRFITTTEEPLYPSEVRIMVPLYLLFSDHALLKLMRLTLRFQGYGVTVDRTAPEVLTVLTPPNAVPSLVLFGDYLPRMSAQRFLHQLHQQPALTQRHGFLFLSTQARALPSESAHLVQELAVPVVALPFAPEFFLEQIAAMYQRLPTY